ncbi:MAG: hypothetical protein II036_08945 [Oscillospiraceae bacterium]|nr:hypothetical protein [Oscillospiraceae bacterium]
MHIHAVDQVHKLDEELPPMYIGQDWFWNDASISDHNVLANLYTAFYDFIYGTRARDSGLLKYFSAESRTTFRNKEGTFSTIPEGGALNMLQPRTTRREAIAKIMQLCRFDFDAGAVNGQTNFWPTFVDAGRPRARHTKPATDPITIKREDCGDVKESKEPVFSSITATVSDVNWIGAVDFDEINDPDMTSRILKYQGITFDYNGSYGDYYLVGIPNDPSHPWGLRIFYIRDYTEDNNARKRPPIGENTDTDAIKNNYGKWLVDSNVATNAWTPENNTYSYLDLSGSKWYQPLDPDAPNETPNSIWNECVYYEDIPEDAEAVDASNQATFFLPTAPRRITKSRAGSGAGYTIQDEMFLMGHAKMQRYDGTGEINLLPDAGINHLLDMSNVVGSFTWKGDPRLQPRDFVNYVYADGELTDENDFVLQTADGDDIIINQSKIITIENITTTHERGGTICEITYREGYC